MDLLTKHAQACILRGDWVAICPRDECNNAEFLPPPGENFVTFRKRYPNNRCTPTCFECTYCGLQAPIIWPSNPEELMLPLTVRPVKRTRNWFPANHEEAMAWGIEHGQTPVDLWLENADHGLGV